MLDAPFSRGSGKTREIISTGYVVLILALVREDSSCDRDAFDLGSATGGATSREARRSCEMDGGMLGTGRQSECRHEGAKEEAANECLDGG